MRRTKALLIWLVVIGALAVVGNLIQRWSSRTSGEPVTGRARVIDGDSLLIGGVMIRLHGIDAVERGQDCRDAGGKPYSCGRAAARALAAAIAGRRVTCTPVAVDRYDRNVATCMAGDVDLSEAVVRAGYALDYSRHSEGRYADAERDARIARRGIWAGTFDKPSTWRERNATRQNDH